MTWDTLRPVLVELATRHPKPVRDGPDPHVVGERRSPFHLRLEPWATDVAAELHRRFGQEVILSVGFFGYPRRVAVDSRGRPLPGGTGVRSAADERAGLADPTELTMEAGADLAIASGHDADVALVVTNHSARPIEIRRLRAVIVDPDEGANVGATMPGGHERAPLPYQVGPRTSIIVDLPVGTASTDPALGYAVPPGAWAVRIFFERSGHVFRAPLLPVTIT